ncbi:hypothetical protein BC833DRAFT_602427 [Globomyces pollinis-pini]|nr:hypothetical protein BC833DRAFT_602427 [Globomyces pollinis-pini]
MIKPIRQLMKLHHSRTFSTIFNCMPRISNSLTQMPLDTLNIQARWYSTQDRRGLKNMDIPYQMIHLIIADGSSKGIMPLTKAMELINPEMEDIVLMNLDQPPICKIVLKSIESKKQKVKPKKPKNLKAIEINTNISSGDFNTKLNRIRLFLEKGSQVKITLFSKGVKKNNELLTEILELLQKNAKVVGPVTANGQKLMFTLSAK